MDCGRSQQEEDLDVRAGGDGKEAGEGAVLQGSEAGGRPHSPRHQQDRGPRPGHRLLAVRSCVQHDGPIPAPGDRKQGRNSL